MVDPCGVPGPRHEPPFLRNSWQDLQGARRKDSSGPVSFGKSFERILQRKTCCTTTILAPSTSIQSFSFLFLYKSPYGMAFGLFSAASSLSAALSFYKIGMVDPCGVPGPRHEPPFLRNSWQDLQGARRKDSSEPVSFGISFERILQRKTCCTTTY